MVPRGLGGSKQRSTVSLVQLGRVGGRLWFELRLVGVGLLAVESESGTFQGGTQSRIGLGARHGGGGVVGQASNIGMLQRG